MTWRPTAPYTVTTDPTLWSHPDLRTLPQDQQPTVVMADDYRVETGPGGLTVLRVGPAYAVTAVQSALDQGDPFHVARDRGSLAEARRRLDEGRWVPPRRDLAVARVLVDGGFDAAVTRAGQTELCWDTRLCHGLLKWRWGRLHPGAERLAADLGGLAHHMLADAEREGR